MLEKLKTLEEYYHLLEEKLSDVEVIKNQQEWKKYTREHASLSETVEAYKRLKKVKSDLIEAEELLQEKPDEEEMVLFLKEEITSLSEEKESLLEKIKVLLLPRDPNDAKDVIIEIRAGAGGEEAALFAADLLKMYLRFTEG